jgi:hypothetical protein
MPVRRLYPRITRQDNVQRLAAGERHAQAQTWDRIVEGMRDLLNAAVARNFEVSPTATHSATRR